MKDKKQAQMFEAVQIVKHKPIPSEIRRRREKCQVGLRELAAIIQISPSYLSKIENGHIDYVSDQVARKIKEAIQ